MDKRLHVGKLRMSIKSLILVMLFTGCKKEGPGTAPASPYCTQFFQSDTITVSSLWLKQLFECNFNKIWLAYSGKDIVGPATIGHFAIVSSFHGWSRFDLILGQTTSIKTTDGDYRIKFLTYISRSMLYVNLSPPPDWITTTFDTAATVTLRVE